MVNASELELTLDRVPVEYPALVKEAVLKINRSEVPTNCATLNDSYCWFLSKGKLLIWERIIRNRNSIPIELTLPPSGLLLSTKCVVIYEVPSAKSSKNPPAVLAISPEGVLRHWPSIKSQTFSEKILDLGSEVVLRVELVDRPTFEKNANFILTTTSGSVYFISGGNLEAHKVAGKEAHGIKRRISSIIFGGLSKEVSLVRNSILIRENNRDITPLSICISPDYLTVYDISTGTEVWTLKSSDFFQNFALMWLNFEMVLMVLIAASHEDANTFGLYLIYISGNWRQEIPLDSSWSCRVPLPEARALFLKSNDSILSNLTLSIPERTAESKTSERTDGIMIINPFFVQTMYVPDDLENLEAWKLTLCKSISLPANDQLIGVATCKQYCYIMLLNSGVATIRLLPKGFSGTQSDFTTTTTSTNLENHQSSPKTSGPEDWGILSEILSEMVATGLPKTVQLKTLNKAFELFGEKDMVKSNLELTKMVEKVRNNGEFAAIVEQYLYAIIDYTDAANTVETELNAKQILTSRMLLFLKHMGVFERVLTAKIIGEEGEERNGAAVLGEINERVAASSSIWKWRNIDNTNAKLFDLIMEKALRSVPECIEIGLSDRDSFFGKCAFVHTIPQVALNQLTAILARENGAKFEHFNAICELFIAIKEGILAWRRSKCSIPKSKNWWTIQSILPSYLEISQKLRDELKDAKCSESERSRLYSYILSIYDFYLGEIDWQPNADQILMDIILLGKVSDGLALAEKHKDFGVLVKITLKSDRNTRQVTLNRLKKLFELDDFEMYLCEYLKTHGLNDVLLEQRGERVDAYLDNFKELRFSREISNKQYSKAAYTLMSLADNETKSFKKFTDYLMRAYFCAKAANPGDQGVQEVLQFYKKRLPELKHRKTIPPSVFAAAHGNDYDVMMSVEEMLEWNMTLQDDQIDGYMRALHLLADLIAVEETGEQEMVLRERVDSIWQQLLDSEEWNRVKIREDIENKTNFGQLCTALISSFSHEKGSSFPKWMPNERLTIIPRNFDDILAKCEFDMDGKHGAWIKAHMKFVGGELRKQADLPEEAFYHPDSVNTGSTSSAVLNWFKPMMELREQRWANSIEA
ncbi:unnamed protein product [Caenorhabditis angaria]|uniref:Uncharacterized protein n=1 Tax=Caenorhabditis angaria TaxID=860376 RepID=A0A9P1ILV9_9PELO|nr:unnamed protein product [Caenorhabditis angaria]